MDLPAKVRTRFGKLALLSRQLGVQNRQMGDGGRPLVLLVLFVVSASRDVDLAKRRVVCGRWDRAGKNKGGRRVRPMEGRKRADVGRRGDLPYGASRVDEKVLGETV
jgi:hypothetical protein